MSVVRNHGFPGWNFWRPVKEGSRSGSDTNCGSNFKDISQKTQVARQTIAQSSQELQGSFVGWKRVDYIGSHQNGHHSTQNWDDIVSFWKNVVDLSEKLVRWQRWGTLGRYQGPWHSCLCLSPTQKVQVTRWTGELRVLFASRGSHFAKEVIPPWKFLILIPSISLEMTS